MKPIRIICLLLTFLFMMGCSASDDDDSDNAPSPTAEVTSVQPDQAEDTTDDTVNALPIDQRLEKEAQFEQLRQLYTQIAGIWDGLSVGESAQCGELFNTLSPSTLDGEDDLNQNLRRAAVALIDAVNLWNAECTNPRETIPPDIINNGVLLVRSAETALAEVESILAGDSVTTDAE